MTTRNTRLSQRKVRSSDPAYPTLKEQLDARNQGGTGGGYSMPLGGIPRTDMTDEVQETLALAGTAYQKPAAGVPFADMDPGVQASLNKADTAYQKPAGGIILDDLEFTIRERLINYAQFYVKPDSGMPEVDMDADVRSGLNLARSAYQKPVMGVPLADLSHEVTDILAQITASYIKPDTGIPISDLEAPVPTKTEIQPVWDHIADPNLHITDHTKLKNIGYYSHNQIDLSLDLHQQTLDAIVNEIQNARDTFTSLKSRIDATIGKNTEFKVDREYEWKKGTFENLHVNPEGNLTFSYTPEWIRADIYDIKNTTAFTEANKLGGLFFTQGLGLNRGDDTWQTGQDWGDYTGARMQFYLYAPVTGEYQFSFIWSGRARLMVAEHLLFEDTSPYIVQSAIPRMGKIWLEGGRMYPVVAEGWYYEFGERILQLYWTLPDRATSEIIPSEYVNIGGYVNGTTGTYTSEVIDFQDTAISQWFLATEMLDWRTEDDISAEMRVSEDGITFTDWTSVDVNGEIAHITPTRFIQMRYTVTKSYDQYTPMLKSWAIRYISSMNNIYYKEVAEARSTFLALKDRLDSIERYLEDIATTQLQFNASNISPEYFVGVRFAAVELNQLRYYYNALEASADYQLMVDGFIDHFNTLNFIDNDLTDVFVFTPGEISQRSNLTIMDDRTDWAKFTRDRIEINGDKFQLALIPSANGQTLTTLDNSYTWSNTAESLLGNNSTYNKIIAQPFYTREASGAIKGFKIRQADYSGTVYSDISIVPAKADGSPDLANPLWKIENVNTTGVGWWTYDQLVLPVIGGKKYFIVIQYRNAGANYYNYWYLAYNNSSASPRVNGTDNPEKKRLPIWNSKVMNPTLAQWTQGSYTLTFTVDEYNNYEPEGFAETIIDYKNKTRFLTTTYDITNPSNGMVEIQYASSDDQATWSSPWQTDITKVPEARWLKMRVHMTRASAGSPSPVLNQAIIGYVGLTVNVISKPFKLGHTPTHVLMIADQPDNQHLKFFASRDDGVTWTEVTPGLMSPLHNSRPGVDLRMRVVFDGNYPTEVLRGWAVQGIYHRDISGQNITALHEEFVAENGQTIFTLENPYQMGNMSLQVFVNGIYQSLYRDYNEVDSHTVEFTEPLIGADSTGQGADIVTFRVATGAYDAHDMNLVKRIDALDDFHKPYTKSHTVDYVYENGKLKQEIYSGIDYYVIEYTYYVDGKQKTITTTTDKTITVESFTYNDDGTIKSKTQTVSEVAP